MVFMQEIDVNAWIPRPKAKFLRVKCQGCSNEQVIFSAPATRVKCLGCSMELAEPSAHNALLKLPPLKVYD